MRLVSFSPEGTAARALGALVDGSVLELARAAAALDVPEAGPALLSTMETLLQNWDHGLLVARETASMSLPTLNGSRMFLFLN
jgi:hypothetical protein